MGMKSTIALLPGDGIGPDVVEQGRMVLEAVAQRFGHQFSFPSYIVGGCAIDSTGEPLPPATLQGVRAADAVLMGAVGGPAWDGLPGARRPEKGLLALRSGLEVFANLRPAVLAPSLREACPLKDSVLAASSADGSPSFDLLIVRELTGGIYFGSRGRSADGDSAFDTETYSVKEIQRLLKVAFEAALGRRRKLCVVDKANVLESSRLWREVAKQTALEYPEVEMDFMYVDNCAMQLIRAPGRFDVIATSNIFGDILSDEASVLTGSIGMLPSASLGSVLNSSGLPRGLYEPIHGSAPDIAGKNLANPLGTILSAAMLLRHSLGLAKEAQAVESAVFSVLDAGYRTADLASVSTPPAMRVGTKEMGALILVNFWGQTPKVE
jgi:3-isopropylmalate dehydrogenase